MKEIAQFGGDVTSMLPAAAADALREALAPRVGPPTACHNRREPRRGVARTEAVRWTSSFWSSASSR